MSREFSARVEIGGQREQLLACDQIDLVQDEHLRRGRMRETRQDRLHLRVEALARIDKQRDGVGVAAPAPGALATMARSSRRFGAKMPGVSTRMICAAPTSAIPRTSERVVCALRETIDTLAPTS